MTPADETRLAEIQARLDHPIDEPRWSDVEWLLAALARLHAELDHDLALFLRLNAQGRHDADELAAVLSALPSSPSPSWQPMDTAPKDGTEVLVHDEGATMIAWWDADESAWVENGPMRPPPQFWRPLPASPSPVTPRRTCPTCGEPCVPRHGVDDASVRST